MRQSLGFWVTSGWGNRGGNEYLACDVVSAVTVVTEISEPSIGPGGPTSMLRFIVGTAAQNVDNEDCSCKTGPAVVMAVMEICAAS